jgi:hypothetical protein
MTLAEELLLQIGRLYTSALNCLENVHSRIDDIVEFLQSHETEQSFSLD